MTNETAASHMRCFSLSWYKQMLIDPTEAVARRCPVQGVRRNFAKFTGKHLCQSLFLNKVAGPADRTELQISHIL